jgi:hypothetical protein
VKYKNLQKLLTICCLFWILLRLLTTMPNPEEKKRRLLHSNDAVEDGNDFPPASFDDLGVDVLANIYAFLPLVNIMCSRCINKKSREAVKITIPPPHDFVVDRLDKYNGMVVMTEALPNLQQITMGSLAGWHKYNDGEDPDEELTAGTADFVSHDIGIISNFSKLKILELDDYARLNGRYPALLNFPLLQTLRIINCNYLKWDLEMLSGFPLLKELVCRDNRCLTGTINRLRVLKDTLEKVHIKHCSRVKGNFMDHADFPLLKELDLLGTAVRGDIRDIRENDFSSLKYLNLPKGVYGGQGYKFQRISDGPDLVRAVYLFNEQRPILKMKEYWCGVLSEDSPDRYEIVDEECFPAPLFIHIVKAGSRLGYRWTTDLYGQHPCEANWLDPEPDRESSEYEIYIEELQEIESEVDVYSGFHQPPTEEEYRRLIEEDRLQREEYRRLIEG